MNKFDKICVLNQSNKVRSTHNQFKKYTILFSFNFIYITFSLKCLILIVVICNFRWKFKRMKRT